MVVEAVAGAESPRAAAVKTSGKVSFFNKNMIPAFFLSEYPFGKPAQTVPYFSKIARLLPFLV